MAVSVRLDPETERVLARLARRGGLTKSAVLRAAVRKMAQAEPAPEPETPYEKLKRLGLIGCIEGDGTDLSSRTGEKVRDILLEKQRRRHAQRTR
jgi:hypothetical protein